MKFTLRIAFVLFLTGYLTAQSLGRRLPGYWETSEHHVDSSLLFTQDKIELQSFYFFNRHQFQRNIIRQSEGIKDTLIYSGNFRASLLNSRIKVSSKNRILVNNSGLLAMDKFHSAIRFTSDSSFILMNNLYFRKKNPALPVVNKPIPPKPGYYLQNKLRETRKVRVPSRKIQIHVDESSLPGEHLSRMNTIECAFDSLGSDSLFLTLFSEEIEIEHRNKFVSLSTSYYAGSFSKVNKKVAVKDILYINMRSPLRQVLYNTGSVIMGASILTIVASPFCGLKLSGDARAAARNRVFTAGISGFAISLPFFIAGKNKKYVLSPAYRSSRKNYWRLKQNA